MVFVVFFLCLSQVRSASRMLESLVGASPPCTEGVLHRACSNLLCGQGSHVQQKSCCLQKLTACVVQVSCGLGATDGGGHMYRRLLDPRANLK
mmetsp:Transcript_60863/g.172168  ORF Transcript_60863/g.172168 Transcript_60863/m.172168 type:complete len:93 (-) Transcript_60863:38-316(-)